MRSELTLAELHNMYPLQLVICTLKKNEVKMSEKSTVWLSYTFSLWWSKHICYDKY